MNDGDQVSDFTLTDETGCRGLHTQRKTFVIGTDRRPVATVADERSMPAHADQALEIVQAQAA